MSRPTFQGAAGLLDVLVDAPDQTPRALAVIGHPHPLFGGANTNKVVHTVARTLRAHGCLALRPNFRGVGKSAGTHDLGNGEHEDMLALIAQAQAHWGPLPLMLSGFSFGAYVQLRVAQRLAADGTPARAMVLVGMAAGRASNGERQYDTPPLPDAMPALIVHGECDDVVPLANVLDWARPQERPVVVIPAADHFFHGRLHHIREQISLNWPLLFGSGAPA